MLSNLLMTVFIKNKYKYYLKNIFIIQIIDFSIKTVIHLHYDLVYHEVYLKYH